MDYISSAIQDSYRYSWHRSELALTHSLEVLKRFPASFCVLSRITKVKGTTIVRELTYLVSTALTRIGSPERGSRMLIRRLFIFGAVSVFVHRTGVCRPALSFHQFHLPRTFTVQPHPDTSLTSRYCCPMSTSNPPASSSSANFTKVFDAATNEYKAITGQDLGTHPFAAAIERFNSPDDILGVFRTQAQSFDKVFKGSERLMICLGPIVNILFSLSAVLNNNVSLSFFLDYEMP
jgi:hypothetical protein